MKCAECVAQDLTSRVYYRGSSSTLLGGSARFWDEEGKQHDHEMNRKQDFYSCTNGHQWVEDVINLCPTCNATEVPQ